MVGSAGKQESLLSTNSTSEPRVETAWDAGSKTSRGAAAEALIHAAYMHFSRTSLTPRNTRNNITIKFYSILLATTTLVELMFTLFDMT